MLVDEIVDERRLLDRARPLDAPHGLLDGAGGASRRRGWSNLHRAP
jgi:hypothetical protein